METRKITKVEKRADRKGDDFWFFTAIREDGRVWMHIIPDSALEFRAAEYGVDPGDTETLLDMVLHEQLFPPWEVDSYREEDPALEKGIGLSMSGKLARGGEEKKIPITPYNAPSREVAKEVFDIRLEYCKKNIGTFKVHEDVEDDPFDKFHSEYEMDLELVDKVREHIGRVSEGRIKRQISEVRVNSSQPERSAKKSKADKFKSILDPRDIP